MEEPDPAENQRESTPDSDFASVVETEPDKRKRASKRKADDPDHKKSYRRSWRSASPLTKLMIYFTGITALATLLYMSFTGWQLYEIRSGSDETRKLAQAARDSADAAQRQANIATEQLQAARDSAKAARDSASTARSTIEQNKDLITAAQKSANATVTGAQIAAKGLYIGNRPYVGAGDIVVVDLEDGKEPVFTVQLKNAGNTPARNLRGIVQIDPRTEPLPQIVKYNNAITQSQAVLLSGGGMIFTIPNGQPINEGGMAIIKAGRETIYIYGLITYTDDLSTKCHALRFCSFYDPSRRRFVACAHYNYEEDKPSCPY